MAQGFREGGSFPVLPRIKGLRMAAGAARVKYEGRKDLMLVVFERPASVAGVFTKSKTASAPVRWDKRVVSGGSARALVVNSGNANAFTGDAGGRAVKQTVDVTAGLLKCAAQQVLVSSTGVIGERLNVQRITTSLPILHKRLRASAWRDVAEAIMTTDTFPKGASSVTRVNGKEVRVSGVAKGSGMIAPNMATMLAYVFTDARLPPPILRRMLRSANDRSFNCITVDGDTSTSDTVLAFATGAVPLGFTPKSIRDDRLLPLRAALQTVMVDLAKQIVRDGEGATKFVQIAISGASSVNAARNIGMTIANSPLVKTAIAGSDPNWGRVAMAVGKSGEVIVQERLRISIGPFLITDEGKVREDYQEHLVAAYMQGQEINIGVDVGVGRSRATVWTCDLTHGYVSINADYRS
ncbi:MAG: bifunctional glutamate N-acetyltransferase/amino-acid acetyltransferase ArgJ [Pseudomonadota bacterium]|nr:bifunctional glutamate N-acetyltransferase/amino-acid acetyltransferase ArgJ [Pseudomonadota bacterium]